MLRSNGVGIILVFDGESFPPKAETNAKRNTPRLKNLEEGLALYHSGNEREALKKFQKAIRVTHYMMARVIRAIRELGDPDVKFLVAPYEADSQCTFLVLNDIAQVVITADSDLLVFGCPTVFYKMDANGHGQEITLDRVLMLCHQTHLQITGWTLTQFREMCVLSGCDYLKSLKGIGLMKAHKMIRENETGETALLDMVRNGTCLEEYVGQPRVCPINTY